MRDEPAAVGVLRSCLVGDERELLTARIRRIAARLGYELLDILDTDTVTDLPAAVRHLDIDAVIAPGPEHLDLEEVHRVCEVVFLDAGEMHYRDGRCEQLDGPAAEPVTEVLVPLYSQAVTSDPEAAAEDVLARLEQALTFTAIIADVPVVIVLPRFHAMFVDGLDLVDTDAWTSAVRAAGARELEDLDFRADPAPGWGVVMNSTGTHVRVELPEGLGGGYLCEGELVAEDAWHQQVQQDHRDGRGLVVVTGTAAPTGEAALEMMEQGRASWLRAHLEITRG